jgi:hypothetical protein
MEGTARPLPGIVRSSFSDKGVLEKRVRGEGWIGTEYAALSLGPGVPFTASRTRKCD